VPQIEKKLATLPGFQDVTTDLQIKNPQVMVDIDRNKASALGVTAQQIENTLYNAYGQRQVSTIYTSSNQYWVILELDPKYQNDPQALSLLYVRSSTGNLIPLNAVASLRRAVGPLSINHQGSCRLRRSPSTSRPGVALGRRDPAGERRHGRDAGADHPVGSFQGTAQVFQSSLAGMGMLL
jgi:HAE1 family hydrophobic/amphiphilic exporter-1